MDDKLFSVRKSSHFHKNNNTIYDLTRRLPTTIENDVEHYTKRFTRKIMGGTGSGRSASSSKKSVGQTNGSFRKLTPSPGQSSLNFSKSNKNFDLTPQKTSTNIGSIPGLIRGKKVDNAPQVTAMDPVVKTASVTTSKTYKMKLLYVAKIKDQKTDVVEKLKCLMARMFQYEPAVQLLPYDPTCKLNPIVSAKDIPSNMTDFHVFAPYAFINSKSQMLRMNFRVSSDLPLWRLKTLPGIKNYLDQFGIFINQTYLATTDNIKVGGLVLSHIQYTRRETATADLNVRINDNETTKTPIQLSPYTMWNGKGAQKISTRLLAIECSKGNEQLVKQRLFTKLLTVPEQSKYSNTRFFKFLPFTATGAITDSVIRSGIYLQNQFLLECTAVTVVNLHSIEWVVPTTSLSFRELVLGACIEGDGDQEATNLFSTVEMATGDAKVHLVTTKTVLEEAHKWMDGFTLRMMEINDAKEYWKETTGFGKPPQRLNGPATSDAQVAYANFLDQTFTPLVGSEVESTAPKQAPRTRSYSRVVYGKGNQAQNQNANYTQVTEVSTLTSDMVNESVVMQKAVNNAIAKIKETADTEKQDMKQSLLEEMRQLNKTADERMNMFEESTNSFEHMIRELHANNKKKDEQFATHERRMETISVTTQSTAKKVDNLNIALKSFVKVMAAVVGTMTSNQNVDQQNALENISNLLDEDTSSQSEDEMELDDDDTTRKRKPPSGTQDALRDGGSKK